MRLSSSANSQKMKSASRPVAGEGGSKRILPEKMLQLKAGMHQPLEKGPAERRVGEQQTQPEETGSSAVSHSRKCHSLIQDQARELTHLRQKMRVGRTFSSLLIQHVRNTVKTFEELLSSNKIDHCMEQRFREQLAKGSQLAESLASKFSTDDCTSEKNQTGHMLQTLSILREMHTKGKVPEALKTKQQAQPQTLPQIQSSSHAQSAAHHSSSSTSLLHEEQEVHPAVAVANPIHHSNDSAVMSSEPSVSGTCLRFRLNSSPTCLSPEFPKEGTWVALVRRRSSIHLKSNLHFLLPSFLFNFPPEKSISVFRELYQSNSGVNNTEKPTLV
ncbi:myomegalin isoform X5 [Panthera leo]|uniref:myomegalin isoform X5 n=1 Tax=Panthera leo TaxID=9689 RepID=UPI001C69DE08|nr:myomegalin isoform X5 [Panthera leo]